MIPTKTAAAHTAVCKLHTRRLTRNIHPAALSQLIASQDHPSILGGNDSCADADRLSYFACDPKETFEFHTLDTDPFTALDRALAKYRLDETPSESSLPHGAFRGGWIGYFGYELARHIERLPATTTDDIEMPLISLAFYDQFICYDHKTRTYHLAALEIPGDRQSPDAKLAHLADLFDRAAAMPIPDPPAGDIEDISLDRVACNMDKPYYLAAIEKIKRHILDGDVYQINFSQRFRSAFDAPPIDLFHWQNRYNPSPFAAYIDDGQSQIVSASPELFITIADGHIITRPIKGTRPRIDLSASPDADKINAAAFEELLQSPKERAELHMIVDLERNDLARICIPGTRTVTQPRTIEPYPTVFHALAAIEGDLRPEITFTDVLKAAFPGGSITGAPKIRSMEIIDETEPTARSVYTGSIGFISIDSSVCLNIAIRTIIIKNSQAFVQTGGGIVADSDPQAEWAETLTKARALLAGIRALQP